jgi:hypothetical protein
MRILPVCVVALSTFVVAPAARAAQAGEPFRGSLEGDWETVIQSPRRPWEFVTHFARSEDGWGATMTFPGFADFPLSEVRAETTWVHFRFPPELESAVFDGTLEGEAILGRVLQRGESVPTRLTRSIELPPPANRIEAWRQDLDFAVTHVCEYDRSFSAAARVEFLRAIGALNLDLPHRNDDQIVTALSRAVALSGNAHTRMRLDPTRQAHFTTEFPIRIWWFHDGPWVIKAAPSFRRALRCRVVAIDGHTVAEARREVARLFAGTEAWADYLTPLYLTCPDLLHGLGLIRSRKEATWTFEDAGGARFDLRIQTASRDAAGVEAWQELSPLTRTGRPPWPSALAEQADRLPLYLQHPERAYWFTVLPEEGLLYFQFNRSENDEAGPSLEAFGDSLIASARRVPVRSAVVDLRLNSGGNLEVARDFVKSLAREEWARPGRLFVVVGHCTFSAGLYHAAQMKQFSPAIFVGEPVGDRLDYWAEGGPIVLPNSGVAIWYSNGFHRYSQTDYPENRPYYEELSIPGLAPDVATPLTSADYFAGRDPALEAVRSRTPK